ncbi:hypothetical protein GW17_00040609 [Ensete ventricosum]|nr:hypothetical protein GW17_00040609 [Ensete ventricosum]
MKPLDWTTRMRIAEGAAKGLEYLHDTANPPVIYRDLKASNILLDKDYNPKLSDFGLAKVGPIGDKSHVSTRVMGTYGYCAPEYALTGQLTKMSDVYSFGVVLLEIITGRRAIDALRPSNEQNLVHWAKPLFKDKKRFVEMADPLLKGKYPIKGLYQAIAIAAMCLQEQASSRPLASDIVTALEYLAIPSNNPFQVSKREKHAAKEIGEGGKLQSQDERTRNTLRCKEDNIERVYDGGFRVCRANLRCSLPLLPFRLLSMVSVALPAFSSLATGSYPGLRAPPPFSAKSRSCLRLSRPNHGKGFTFVGASTPEPFLSRAQIRYSSRIERRFLALAPRIGGSGNPETSRVDEVDEMRGQSTMPERFRHLTKEAPDRPVRWPWVVGMCT